MKSSKTKLKPGEISRRQAYTQVGIPLRDPVMEAKLRLKEDTTIEEFNAKLAAQIKSGRRSVDEMYQLARQVPPFITMQRCTYDDLEKNNNAGIKALLKDNFPAFMNVDIRDVVFYLSAETAEFRLVGRKRSYAAKK